MQRVKRIFNEKIQIKFATKLYICLFFCALVPAILTVSFFYRQLIANTVSETLESRQSALSSLDVSVESYIGNLSNVADAISSDSRLEDLLETSSDSMKDASSADPLITAAAQLFQSATEAYLKEDSIIAIKIYTEKDCDLLNSLCVPQSSRIFEPLEKVQYSYWKGLMDITGEKSRLISASYLTWDERVNLGNIACIRRIDYFLDGELCQAFLAVYSSETLIINLLSDSSGSEDAMYYLIDANDYMVTLSENIADNFGLYIQDYDKWSEEFAEDRTFRKMDFGQGDDYVAAYPLRNTQWILVWIIPEKSIVGTSTAVLQSFLVVYVILLAVIFVTVWWIVHQLLGRLMKLKDHMNTVQNKFPREYTGDTKNDEIGELIRAYNYMISQNNQLHQQEMKTITELNQLKVETMRAQIDPHFLYNTLDMIRWMSANGEQKDVEKAIKLLSRFYRLTTNKGNQMIQVRDELEHVELYMELMNMRFDNRINFVIDVPDEMMEFEIPVLIFQPIVENAISHGIFEKESQAGNISVTGWTDRENLYFEIADDGIGMSPEQLEKLLSEDAKSKAGIGVFNTLRRLKLLYPDRGRLIFRSTPGEGTEVEYQIPVSAEKEDTYEEN